MVVGQFTQETSLAVIGGGAGGYTAALRAAELGVQTVLVDPDGACPHHWWLYSKTLSDVGRLMRLAAHASQRGVEFARPDFDLHKLRQWTRQMSETLTTQLQERCTELGVEVIRGTASFENARQIMVHNGPRLRFKRAIVATGATPVPPPGGWGDSRRVTDWTGVGEAETLPARLLILGGGPTAVELADTYAALGCTVAIATPAERLLPETDPDLVRPLESRLARTLDEISVATTVSAIAANAKKVQVDFKFDGATSQRTFDHVMYGTLDNVLLPDLGIIAAAFVANMFFIIIFIFIYTY